jgi:mannitol 2-dehydrogenase
MYVDRLLESGQAQDWGICGVGVLPGDRAMRDALRAQDGLYTLMVKHPDGTVEPRVVGSLVEYLFAPDDPEAVIEKMADPATRIVSLTITEGGYHVDDVTGVFDASAPEIAKDLTGTEPPATAFGLVTEALRRRRDRGVEPFTLMSCDNLEGNGAVARTAFGTFAHLLDPALGAWIEQHVPFPNSMVDRITPATTDVDRLAARELFGIEDAVPVVCEPFLQWVLEGSRAGVLPPYADVGVRIVEDVHAHERMKLRLLNAGHQAVTYFGILCGYTFVHEAARDPDIQAFLEAYLDLEAVPTVGGVPPEEIAAFRAAIPERFGNPAIADTLERIATDASDRIPKFLLPVVRDRLASGADVTCAAAVIASWARYADGADEQGHPLAVVDRRHATLTARARRRHEEPDAFISDTALFGDIAEHEAFVRPYRATLASLDERGARATLRTLL